MQPNCPYCGEKMIPGVGYVRGTFFGFIFFGLSHQHFWFRRKGGRKPETVIRSGDQRAGHQCPYCGTVAVQLSRKDWKRNGQFEALKNIALNRSKYHVNQLDRTRSEMVGDIW